MRYPKILQDYINHGKYDETWSSPERNQFLFHMMFNQVQGKKFVETGSKSGVFTYGAYKLGATLAVGVEQEPALVLKANQTMASMGAPQPICHSYQHDAITFDYSWFDICFCIGLLYNINKEDKTKLLQSVSKCPLVFVECWLYNDGSSQPSTKEINQADKPQWFPNRIEIQRLLSEFFIDIKEMTPKSFLGYKFENTYFMCQK